MELKQSGSFIARTLSYEVVQLDLLSCCLRNIISWMVHCHHKSLFMSACIVCEWARLQRRPDYGAGENSCTHSTHGLHGNQTLQNLILTLMSCWHLLIAGCGVCAGPCGYF